MQILFNGLISGFSIALLAVAFQSVYLPTRVFFIGLAGIYSLTPFLAHTVLARGGGWPLAIVVSVAGAVAVSVLCEWANHARLTRRQASDGIHLIASLGTYIVLVQITAMFWGNETKSLSSGLGSLSRMGDVVVTGAQWTILGAATLLIGGYALFLTRSDLGLRLRALADNPVQFALYGHNVDRHRLLAFCVAGLFAAVSSLVTAHDIGFDPYVGLPALLLGVVAVMVGGQGSFAGPVLGALLLGCLRAEVAWYWSARWQEAVTFGLLALILLLRPQGLLGRKARLEATT